LRLRTWREPDFVAPPPPLAGLTELVFAAIPPSPAPLVSFVDEEQATHTTVMMAADTQEAA
jgi:hypothetical protein